MKNFKFQLEAIESNESNVETNVNNRIWKYSSDYYND